ncbi:hypothetical protein [Halospeciosus flavus]|uniref:hypothetical protein n=1 Tax=Halospeciosus flavus TaxID=3032283 RepID=UPI003619A1D8
MSTLDDDLERAREILDRDDLDGFFAGAVHDDELDYAFGHTFTDRETTGMQALSCSRSTSGPSPRRRASRPNRSPKTPLDSPSASKSDHHTARLAKRFTSFVILSRVCSTRKDRC